MRIITADKFLPGLRLELPNGINCFIWRNVGRSFYALWCYVKYPRENCGNNKAQREKHDDSSHHAWRCIECGQKNRCGLDQQPRDNSICGCDSVNLPPFQFGQELTRLR